MDRIINQNGKMLSGYLLTNIGWEGIVGLFVFASFLVFGQM